MAEFCKQCSEVLFGEDFKELAGRVGGMVALCEGCGDYIKVDSDGKRVDQAWVNPFQPEPREVK